MTKKLRIILSLFLSIIIVFFTIILLGNFKINITEYEYANEKIPTEFDNFKIVQLSDLHNRSFGKDQKRLIEKIKLLNPDIIVFTGDIVSRNDKNLHNAEVFIKEILKICPVYLVEGNHEKYCIEYMYMFRAFLSGCGVNVLRNESARIEIGDSFITISGMRNPVFDSSYGYDVVARQKTFKDWVKEMSDDSDDFKILLSHHPEYFDSYCKNGFDLTLTGHAHGGQVILPFIGGVFAPNQGFNPKYYAGEYTDGTHTMIVNRGLGNSTIFPRINNSPEIVSITLKTKK